jgi:hypothetical protein
LTCTVVADTTVNRVGSLTGGQICAAVSAADLDRSPFPTSLNSLCPNYRGGSMLDLIVGGCTYFGFPQINPVQPDVDLGGDGLMRPALRDANNDGQVDECRDGSGLVLTGNDCAQDPRFDDAYSVAISFSAVRVAIQGAR